jgi:tellurite resistance protein TehA-like permease
MAGTVSGSPVSASVPAAPATGLAAMHPAYFALVMATGIVSVASHLLGLRPVAITLFWANAAFYVILWSLTITRLARFPDRVKADLLHHGRCVGFFTSVAATCVLGTQVLLIGRAWGVATGLWLFGILLWAGLTYGIFMVLTVKQAKPSLSEGINGGWLLSVVAAQAVSVLGSQLSAGFGEAQQLVLLYALVMWLGGGMLYIWIISLIFYRYTFFTLSPSDLAPPYWINMGAVAISTLAGTMLIASSSASPLLTSLLPFLKGFTLFFWATATWWIPMLVILGVWRHVYRHFPFRYDSLYWGAVFPLGMYTACTFRVAQVMDVPLLVSFSRYFIWVAIAAWAIVFGGLLHHLPTYLGVGRKPR